jgi:hypothetical protein
VTISTVAELKRTIESAWSDLEAYLRGLPPQVALEKDAQGWTVRDHITHMAVWEESVAIVFQGGRRHEALGIDEAFYRQGTFDEINEVIKNREQHLTLDQAVARLARVHESLLDHLRRLSDDDLQPTVREFFPSAPATDERPVSVFLYDNSAGHILEHLPWMKAIAGR